jgi:hypothetical protein
MEDAMFHVPEAFRIVKGMVHDGRLASNSSYGNNGAFIILSEVDPLYDLMVIASDGGFWEHVSVSGANYLPSWEEMCRIKDIFWDAEDCVIQYHPPKSCYINDCVYCLHLWRPTKKKIPMPPMWMVGKKYRGLILKQEDGEHGCL